MAKPADTPEQMEARFWRIFDTLPIDERGCRLWPKPYGHFYHWRVHRYALTLKLGRPIAPGMLSCHDCGNPRCVNFDHLYEGTKRDNSLDCERHGTGNTGRKKPQSPRFKGKRHTEETKQKLRDARRRQR